MTPAPEPADPWDALLATLGEPLGVTGALALTERLTRQRVGCRLYTVMACDLVKGEARRIHTSDPLAYPLAGAKPIVPNRWTRTVLDGRQPLLADTLQAIAEVFPDHELIGSLGLGSCLNVPVVVEGAVRGTVNILDQAGHFTPERVAAALALRPFYAVALLAAAP